MITADKLITDCQTYDNKASSVICTLCVATKFLSSNTCTNARVISLNLAQCKTTVVDADKCATCNDGFSVTTDNKLCLASIANCVTYTGDSTATALTCTACKNTFYVNNANGSSSCVAGGIDGCLVYTTSAVCSICNPVSHYLSGSTCLKHQFFWFVIGDAGKCFQ